VKLCISDVITTSRVRTLRMEEMAFRYWWRHCE